MDEKERTVAVIMSTYNGERFLREQIESILSQSNINVRLFVRDDGSQDGTAGIIAEYAKDFPNVVFWNMDHICNLGIRDSFLTLLKEVHNAYPEIKYFAFADQDDVWKQDKLSAAVSLMCAQSPDEKRPALYYSNKTFVDTELQHPEEEHIKFYGDFYDILWSSLASGCTMVMNRPLVSLSVRELPENYPSLHDAWIYRLAVLCGAVIVFDQQSYIMYRQHGNNVCGKDAVVLVHKGAFSRMFTPRHFVTRAQIMEFLRLHESDISQENRRYVDWVMHYDKSFSAWWNLAFCPLARKRGTVMHCIWLAKLILRRV